MTYSFLEEALGGIRSGTFFRIGYITELPVKAAYSKEGWKILKKTESTVRTGVNYGKIKSVVEERKGRSEVTPTRKNHIVPIQKGRIYQNTDTEQMYLRVFPTKKGTNKKVSYILVTPGHSEYHFNDLDEEMREMVRDSYFNEKSRPIATIKIDNIYKVGDYQLTPYTR